MYDKNVIEALARLRAHAHPIGRMDDEMRQCFNALDNAGVFAALDEQTDYASAMKILAESATQGYAAVSRLGKLERVPGTNTLRPARTPRDDVAPHEHIYMDGHPEELCLYGSCVLTYAEFQKQA